MKNNLFAALMGAACAFGALAPVFAISCVKQEDQEATHALGYTETASKNIRVIELHRGACVAILAMKGHNSYDVSVAMASVPCEAK